MLELPPTASLEQVDAAFTRLAKIRHPDVGGSHEAMAALTEARATARTLLEARP